ncbi:ATP-binding protein [Planomonospora sp. ID67723]|uniref:ATP-binding protein n=1 Tax=Planomonospora sp. ID67723 TaxID=2738134 RepID=UPI0018C40C9F|nr:ATP-binding protein [Planomonospora sp. ID67723]MBG0833360.1 ATP-binding protein [Planomonospora sp. ID67723]
MPDDENHTRTTHPRPDRDDGAPELLARRRFAGLPEQVRHARNFVALAVGECAAAEDAILLTSELAGNAVRHTESGNGGSFEISVYLGDSFLRIEVTDEGTRLRIPRVRLIDLDAEQLPGGRGLAIVELCATRWGQSGDVSGRIVWFELPCDGRAVAEDGLDLVRGA